MTGIMQCIWGVSARTGQAQKPFDVLYLPRDAPGWEARMVGWASSPWWTRWNRWRAHLGDGIRGENR